jgi:hypothetical protein
MTVEENLCYYHGMTGSENNLNKQAHEDLFKDRFFCFTLMNFALAMCLRKSLL